MTEPRFCAAPGCGKLLVQRPGEKIYKFLKRKTCGRACAGETIKRPFDSAPRYCAWSECGALLVRGEGESFPNFCKRNCCNRAHAGHARAKPKPELDKVKCPHCGGMFTPQRPSQTYCSSKCAVTARNLASWAAKRNAEARAKPLGRYQTVEEWLAAGNVITRIETPPSALMGVPVRGKAGDWSGGRVRR